MIFINANLQSHGQISSQWIAKNLQQIFQQTFSVHFYQTRFACMEHYCIRCVSSNAETNTISIGLLPNRRQKVFNMGALQFWVGALCLRWGAWHYKIYQTPLIYSVSRFNLGGLRALFGRLNPSKLPVATGLGSCPLGWCGIRYMKAA